MSFAPWIVEVFAVNYFIPYYINERQSDLRGIKNGWYTMDERGNLHAGPFASPCECLERGCQPHSASTPVWLH